MPREEKLLSIAAKVKIMKHMGPANSGDAATTRVINHEDKTPKNMIV
jgi:hypothetical protein